MAVEDHRTVRVSGRGKVAVEPDLARIRAGVGVQDRTPEGAMSIANDKMRAVLAALTDAGIPDDDATLGRFSVDTVSDYVDGRRVHRGYRVSHTLTITLRDIDRTGEILALVVRAGANDIDDVSFSVEKPEPHTDRARELAFDNARHKANELARLAGVSLGRVVEIRETTYEPVTVEHHEVYSKASFMVAESRMDPPPINPEDSEFSVHLEVSWALD